MVDLQNGGPESSRSCQSELEQHLEIRQNAKVVSAVVTVLHIIRTKVVLDAHDEVSTGVEYLFHRCTRISI